jgi:hypothetical protein
MRFLTNVFRRPARRAVRRTSIILESLEERQLLSAAPVSAPFTFSPPITAATVKNAIDALYKTSPVITLADARKLFGVVDGAYRYDAANQTVEAVANPAEHGQVSASALKELDTIFAHPQQWGILTSSQQLITGEHTANKGPLKESPPRSPSGDVDALCNEILRGITAGEQVTSMRTTVDAMFETAQF